MLLNLNFYGDLLWNFKEFEILKSLKNLFKSSKTLPALIAPLFLNYFNKFYPKLTPYNFSSQLLPQGRLVCALSSLFYRVNSCLLQGLGWLLPYFFY